MLKCGQKDNKDYTFGIRKEGHIRSDKKEIDEIYCHACGFSMESKNKFCPSCGAERGYK
jgi:rubrerythrin